jgi:hypothetical protein
VVFLSLKSFHRGPHIQQGCPSLRRFSNVLAPITTFIPPNRDSYSLVSRSTFKAEIIQCELIH